MGVDLTLLPVECDCDTWGYAHTVLEIGRNYQTHRKLEQSSPKPRSGWDLRSYFARVPDGSCKGERCYGKVVETAYGEPITYLSSDEIVKAMHNSSGLLPQEKAALAYLRAIPTCQVALYWH